jgi:phosphatidylinositol phospholipase C delta
MSGLSSRLAKLRPFSKSVEDEDQGGEQVESNTIAGGGHSSRPTDITDHQLRVSHALRSFLVDKEVLDPQEAGLDSPTSDFSSPALHALLGKPHIQVPSSITDRSHPLPEYFISSSHNTYLLANQLFGTSSATAYETALKTGARCIEIDAWDDDDHKDEPKVTHGFTLVSHIPFRAVCETIRDVVDGEAAQASNSAPVLISLENHCGAHGQMRLVRIMEEVWGDRLLSEAVRQKGHAEQQGSESHVLLSDLGSKIVVIVEYHFLNEPDSSSLSGSSSDPDSDPDSEPEDEESRRAKKEYEARRKAAPKTLIIPELAALGVYAQSVKPLDDSWYTAEYPPGFKGAPHHHLINVSETGLASKLPTAAEQIAKHNAKHLMRVFPKGTRVSSRNLDPVPFWGVGAQICALNWQTFGAPLQLNEALFAGTDGFVLKPSYLRGDAGPREKTRRKLRLRVAGATDVPVPGNRSADEVKLYLSCLLDHPGGAPGGAAKRKTAGYKQHKLGFLHKGENPPPTDPLWDEVLEWEYDEDELVFLRMLVKSDDSFSRNPKFAVATVRILYAAPGWNFIRMLDLKGRETRCSLLVKIEVEDV